LNDRALEPEATAPPNNDVQVDVEESAGEDRSAPEATGTMSAGVGGPTTETGSGSGGAGAAATSAPENMDADTVETTPAASQVFIDENTLGEQFSEASPAPDQAEPAALSEESDGGDGVGAIGVIEIALAVLLGSTLGLAIALTVSGRRAAG
jgi:hypothetical protein